MRRRSRGGYLDQVHRRHGRGWDDAMRRVLSPAMANDGACTATPR